MSTYLQIAEAVLEASRKPLTSYEILKKAYLENLVPDHLYGKTQHKTLQARLSVDILDRKEKSAFFRTEPGHFFLRKFITDKSLPIEYRQPITARRRIRDILRGPALAFNIDALIQLFGGKPVASPSIFDNTLINDTYNYVEPKSVCENQVLVWSIAIVRNSNQILSYRVGKYRDNRDAFLYKKTVGFSTLVLETNKTLFDINSLGIIDSAISAASVDLDIPMKEILSENNKNPFNFKLLALTNDNLLTKSLLAFVEIKTPDWFHPNATRLSLNDLRWMDIKTKYNDTDDFDPWSQIILKHYSGEECDIR